MMMVTMSYVSAIIEGRGKQNYPWGADDSEVDSEDVEASHVSPENVGYPLVLHLSMMWQARPESNAFQRLGATGDRRLTQSETSGDG